jgi:ABC-2 type transport system ATP-binding protein
MNSQMHPLIRVQDVHRAFGKKRVLDGISIDVPAGCLVALLGPSGAGKTTLVKMMAGTDEAQKGFVEVEGQRMPHLGTLKDIGYMAQSDALYLELTGRDNLEFFGAMYGLRNEKLKSAIDWSADLVDLQPDLDRPVEQYSGGMKRRLSLAITLLHQPKIVILDEPTVGLDPVLRKSVWEELRRYADKGAAILITTHVMDEAQQCDTVCMLRDGKLIAHDTPKALMSAAQVDSMQDAFLYYASH